MVHREDACVASCLNRGPSECRGRDRHLYGPTGVTLTGPVIAQSTQVALVSKCLALVQEGQGGDRCWDQGGFQVLHWVRGGDRCCAGSGGWPVLDFLIRGSCGLTALWSRSAESWDPGGRRRWGEVGSRHPWRQALEAHGLIRWRRRRGIRQHLLCWLNHEWVGTPG